MFVYVCCFVISIINSFYCSVFINMGLFRNTIFCIGCCLFLQTYQQLVNRIYVDIVCNSWAYYKQYIYINDFEKKVWFSESQTSLCIF